jgi:thioredoxin 1
VYKFGAGWCNPCKMVKLDGLSQEFPNIEFKTIDVDDFPDLAKQYKIKSLPTIIVLFNDTEVDRIVGVEKIDVIRKKITNRILDIC